MALMALEEDIVNWSKDRPAWQREVLRRTAAGVLLSNDDYDQLVDEILNEPDDGPGPAFGLEHLPKATAEDPSVRIVSIAKPEHVNALASDQPLTFEIKGLTIVYGDNGSGKSGYARLLKRITRAPHQEEVLSDVFRDTTLAKPTATLSVRIGDKDESLSWPDSTPPELQRMLFYDSACGSAYIATESDFPYRPSALAVMDGLINACVAVRNRIDAKLTENARSSAAIPTVAEELKNTGVGKCLTQLSGSTSIDALDALIKRFEASNETIDDLKNEEARLRSIDTSAERQRLTRQAEKLDALRKYIDKVHSMLGNDGLSDLQERRAQLGALQKTADLVARSFESQPLSGVGSTPWKVLWESARRFSEEHAYSTHPFPVVGEDGRCVLCQEALSVEARDRLLRFERFVKDDTQVRLDEARGLFDAHVARFTKLLVSPDAVASDQKDLEVTHSELIGETRALLDRYESARDSTLDALAGTGPVALFGIESGATLTQLTQAATTARDLAAGLANPTFVQERLAVTTGKRQELELLQATKSSRSVIVKEIGRRTEREALEAVKTAAATGAITKKVLELSEESITEVVRDTFIRETDRLRLERVTIARTRADRGALLHQPKLVGARQDVKLPRVFSEGERTALGLAAFFTEAHLDGSRSALILDDPVTSLDHIRRGLVAARLAELAEGRQVIMFTHDVSFVADLKREAGGRGVLVTERSVTRSRADERKPGSCSTKHPWKAKDVPARLDSLRQELNRIRRDCGTWDETGYEEAVAVWAGNLSETWEGIFSQEIVGQVLAEGGLEVRPTMVKILARFTDQDHREFEASYSRVSQWLKRHNKSTKINYVSPEVAALEQELDLVDAWFKRVKGYKA
jgi:energy-coupling factor transporter ATP-binding protein EcfA2